MEIDYHINVAAIAGGVIFLVSWIVFATMFYARTRDMDFDLKELKDDFKHFTEKFTSLSVLENRVSHCEDDIRLLRKGEGFIFPLQPSHKR